MTARLVLLPAMLIALCITARAQGISAGADVVEPSQLSLYAETTPARYAGAYQFGFSEGESELTLAIKGTRVTGVFIYGVFDEKSSSFKPKRHRFQGRIVGSMLVAPGWSGVFVSNNGQKGLVFFQAPTDYANMQFGYRLDQ